MSILAVISHHLGRSSSRAFSRAAGNCLVKGGAAEGKMYLIPFTRKEGTEGFVLPVCLAVMF